MTPNIATLLRRDLQALDDDLGQLRDRINGIRFALAGGGESVLPRRATLAAETANRIHSRLREVEIQAAQAFRSAP